ncbi:MAG: hypothetical protein Fur0020_14070 [Thermodesulfovibrionia bacterium]
MRQFIMAVTLIMLVAGLTVVGFADEIVSTYVKQPTTEYWTKERMMNAKPYPMPSLSGAPQSMESAPEEMLGGLAGINKGGLPGTSILLSEDENAVIGLTGAVQPMDAYAYPPPQTTFYVYNPLYGTTSSVYPYMAIGKVFFTKSGVNYVCSGSSIGGRAVLTAGHCVSDGAGHWHTNWKFAPSYRNGTTPYGLWSAFALITFTAWHTQGNFCRDVGFAAVSDIGGLKLSQKVGYLGFAWNQSRTQHFNVFGYPAASPYNGQRMVETQASYNRTDTSCSPGTTGIGWNQAGGSSGGPWILQFFPGSAGAMNYANGVNSYIYTSQPKQIYSPYFDSNVKYMKDIAVSY